MNDLQSIGKKGSDAVRKLRLEKLRTGHPFMINSRELESNYCYLEYPDGSIQLVYLKSSAKEFTVIRLLTTSEALVIRNKYGLTHI